MPEGSIVVFSAHGVAPEVHEQAAARSLRTIDATCPLVTKVHHEVRRFAKDDYDILLIGHEGHEEVVGTSGEAPEHITLVDGPDDVADVEVRDPEKVVWLSQTTLSVDETMQTVDALRERFPLLQSPPSDDICYATQNRQAAVKTIAPAGRAVPRRRVGELVQLGADGRGRARRRRARPRYLVENAAAIDEAWLDGVTTVGLSSGASVPEVLVQRGRRLAGRARLRRRRGGQPHRGAADVRAAAGAAPRPAHAARRSSRCPRATRSTGWRASSRSCSAATSCTRPARRAGSSTARRCIDGQRAAAHRGLRQAPAAPLRRRRAAARPSRPVRQVPRRARASRRAPRRCAAAAAGRRRALGRSARRDRVRAAHAGRAEGAARPARARIRCAATPTRRAAFARHRAGRGRRSRRC